MFVAGLIILVINVIVAAFSPNIAPHDPIRDLQVADDYALPAWVGALAEFSDFPRNTLVQVPADGWKIESSGPRKDSFNIMGNPTELTASYISGQEAGVSKLTLRYGLRFNYSPPKTFIIRVPFSLSTTGEGIAYRLTVAIVRLSDSKAFVVYDTFPPWRTGQVSQVGESSLVLHSRDPQIARRLGIQALLMNVAESVFAEKGHYEIFVETYVRDEAPPGRSQFALNLGTVTLRIPGLLYGLLGTNNVGADVFSQLVYGARVSLIVGFLSISIAVILGLLVGVFAGYRGGLVDQSLMFFTDTIMQTPTLPIILLVMLVLGRNLYLIIAILALVSWPSLARQIRAWVLSLKERAFVEAAKAIGAGDFYIMFAVIAPQTLPLIAYVFILGVPSAVFIEIGLSLIGFGDPFLPSWGKMINEAFYGGAYSKLAWWWVAPPIVAILLLALSFVFIGYTLEETIQPTLKVR